ncbi:MAG: AMP-binding protein [Alphaproteobacteria bacterium]
MFKVFDALKAHARATPEKPAIRNLGGRTISYRELTAAVSFIADVIPEDARTIALLGGPNATWIAVDLAITLLGRRLVPLPFFFSPAQINHAVTQADVDMIVDTGSRSDNVRIVGVENILHLCDEIVFSAVGRHPVLPPYEGGAERVIYTSGTTGQPKGVRHGDRQLTHAIDAIAETSQAASSDRHLCLLPQALLLEQIAGQFVPIVSGAEVSIAGDAILTSLTGDGRAAAEAVTVARPTTTILVPAQLEALLAYARKTDWQPPDTLRLVAVGGAPASARTLEMARSLGLPVRFGYGLSECCSVVSLDGDSPGEIEPGAVPSAGPPLPGTEVWIEDGEIVVRSPGVMIGYLGYDDAENDTWHTGDVGRIRSGGRLTVFGRRDRVMVLPNGRNVSPEWIESLALASGWVGSAKASLTGEHGICLTISPGLSALSCATSDEWIAGELQTAFADLPAYARPSRVQIVTDGQPPRTIRLSEKTEPTPETVTL